MREKKKPKTRRLFLIIGAIAILLITIGLILNSMQKKNELKVENWDERSPYNVSDLTIQGIVYDVKTNFKIEGHYTYHVFPALIYVNITQVVWASDQLMSEMGIIELKNDTWHQQKTIVIAYDKPDAIQISKGQLIEASGCYYRLSISVYALKLVVAQSVNGSYVKPL
ncbi:MAG: hypothetical protein QXQ02_09750 [Halobacteria archaeon]|jgi:hypothetical protein